MAFRKSETEHAGVVGDGLNLEQLEGWKFKYRHLLPNLSILTLRETKPEGLNAEAGAACFLTSSTTGTTLVSLLL